MSGFPGPPLTGTHRGPVTDFSKRSPAPLAFNKAEGLLIGWLCFSDKDGQPYVDLHGDHFPADELFKAADELMAKPAAERMLNVEHAGGGVGEIRTVYAVTPEIAKAHGWDTGGTYGLVGSVKPDAALMKSIADGELACFSIEGKAAEVEVVKAAGDVAATAHKRTMRKVSITKLALVKAGAHEGAGVALIKTAAQVLRSMAVAKRTAALTSETAGHQHLVYDLDEPSGCTSGDPMNLGVDGGWHSHPFVREPDGSITIGAANGHSHTLATPSTEPDTMPDPALAKAETDLTAAKESIGKLHAELDALEGLLGVAASMTEDEKEVAKGLKGPALREFLAQPADVRKSLSAPIYKSTRTGQAFRPGQEALAEVVKDADATHAELAKERDARRDAEFAKRAATDIPNLPGALPVQIALLKAVDGIADEAVRKAASEALKGANAAMSSFMKAPGVGGGNEPGSPQAELDGIAKGIQGQNPGMTFAKAIDLATDTPRGKQLYALSEKRPS
jgi:hypothetical protein